MHYYKFNIADWVKDTAHLTLKEEAILLRLFNYYISTETNIPTKTQMVLRKLRLGDESETVEILLEEFFTKEKDGYHIKELDKLISEYQKRAEKNRNNGKSGGRPKNNDLAKPTGLPDANQVDTESKPDGNLNYKPLTKNQEPPTKDKKTAASTSLDFSSWPSKPSDEVLKEWFAMRKRKKASCSQMVMNSVGKELTKAASFGFTVEQCFE
ncbi:MAG: DUF1376 domain-containing protein, partial [bacterium]|nr:DUF1376 domain-containing protein [bacterium]